MITTVGLTIYNIAFALLLAPLFAGITRRLRARLHSRQGPPLLQPYFDVLKLLGKSDSRVTGDWVFQLAPMVVMMGAVTAALLVPMGARAPLAFGGDGLVLIYLLTFSAIGTVLAGLSSHSPYAGAGASREITLLLVVEPVMAAAFFTVGLRSGSLALGQMGGAGWAPSLIIASLASFLAMQAESAKLPFDIAEAETELMGGPFVEYSGTPMAAFQWALMVRHVVLASFFVALFAPAIGPSSPVLLLLLHPVKVLIVLVLMEVVAALSPRLRIGQAIRFYAGAVVLALAGLVFAIFGA